jgi:hypothetical protein
VKKIIAIIAFLLLSDLYGVSSAQATEPQAEAYCEIVPTGMKSGWE